MPAGGPRRWGFHQLTDSFARQLVEFAGVVPGDLVLDIGAGTGAITAPLVASGARVVAIELHPDRLAALRRRFAADSAPSGPGSPNGRVRVVRADAADLRLPRRPFKVVANPPWSVTTPLIRRLTAPGSRLIRADLVVERAAARRWVAGQAPGARRWARQWSLELTMHVPRSAFRPRAPRDAAVLTLQRR